MEEKKPSITLGKKFQGLVTKVEVCAVVYNEDGTVYQDYGVVATESFDDEGKEK